MKKFIVTLLFGAFLFSTLAATVGCGGDTTVKDTKDKKVVDKDKPADKDKKPGS